MEARQIQNALAGFRDGLRRTLPKFWFEDYVVVFEFANRNLPFEPRERGGLWEGDFVGDEPEDFQAIRAIPAAKRAHESLPQKSE